MSGLPHGPHPGRHHNAARALERWRQAEEHGRTWDGTRQDRPRRTRLYNVGLTLIIVAVVGLVIWWLAG
jgi:hypothetical protein